MPFPTITPTVPALLHAAEIHGATPFLIAENRELSYTELEFRSAVVARRLLAAGLGKGDHVGILMPNGIEWALVWFAATRIGAVAVPLNTFQKPAELGWTVHHADLKAIVTVPGFRGQDFLGRLEETLPGLAGQDGASGIVLRGAPLLRHIAVWGGADRQWATTLTDDTSATDRFDRDVLAAVESCVTPSDDATIIYTSGSTGIPKAPVHSQGALVRHTYNLTFLYGIMPGTVLFTAMPFFWIGGLITGLHAVLHHGATLVTQAAFDAGEALELIERHRATVTLGWPQQGRTLAAHPDFSRRDLSSVQRTSMPASVPPARRPGGPSSLGMTELCGNHIGVDPYAVADTSRGETGGWSVDGLEHVIVDPETGSAVPCGTPGEIAVRGYSLMQRMHKREREEIFTADGYYRTGDCGIQHDDGWITFTGRLGDLIKTGGGVNVTPGEVEQALTDCPGVAEAYVVGVDDPDLGVVVGAAVVPHPGAAVDDEALRATLRERISAYKVPRIVWVTAKDRLPFTPTGKILRTDLADRLRERAIRRPTSGAGS